MRRSVSGHESDYPHAGSIERHTIPTPAVTPQQHHAGATQPIDRQEDLRPTDGRLRRDQLLDGLCPARLERHQKPLFDRGVRLLIRSRQSVYGLTHRHLLVHEEFEQVRCHTTMRKIAGIYSKAWDQRRHSRQFCRMSDKIAERMTGKKRAWQRRGRISPTAVGEKNSRVGSPCTGRPPAPRPGARRRRPNPDRIADRAGYGLAESGTSRNTLPRTSGLPRSCGVCSLLKSRLATDVTCGLRYSNSSLSWTIPS